MKHRALAIPIATLVLGAWGPCTPEQVKDYATSYAIALTDEQVTAVAVASVTPEAPKGLAATKGGPSARQWRKLRDCESTNNYRAVSKRGTFRGAYQFNRKTWNSVAKRHNASLVGKDPASAAPADQDQMAYWLWSERGWQPWPQCGPKARRV